VALAAVIVERDFVIACLRANRHQQHDERSSN
jgi:hypothetical protein